MGGPGGDVYDELCPDGRFVIGLRGSEDDGAPIVADSGTELAPIRCSEGLVAVGYHGSENGNELVSHLQLSCARLDWEEVAVVRVPSETTGELGSPDDFATADGLCDGGMVAGGIAGRSGLSIDAFALDCFAVEARPAG